MILYIISFGALGIGIYLRKQGNPKELLFWTGVITFGMAVVVRKMKTGSTDQ